MSALMPDGERFSGKYVVVRQGNVLGRIEPAWAGDDPVGTQGDIDTARGGRRGPSHLHQRASQQAIARLKG